MSKPELIDDPSKRDEAITAYREEQSIDRLVTNFARNLVSTMLEAF